MQMLAIDLGQAVVSCARCDPDGNVVSRRWDGPS